MELDEDTRERLKGVGVATLCTALFKRGLRSQLIQEARPVGPFRETMVGRAFTLRTIPAREDRNPVEVFRDPEHPQRKAIETCPEGFVLVVDSRRDPRAASAGSILIARLKARGCAGFVTDGGLRDSATIAGLGLPCYHVRPSPPTNLTRHEMVESDVPIACGEAPVFPGDVIVGDAEGVVVLPAHLAGELAEEAAEMERYERFAAEQVAGGRSIIGLYPATTEAARRDYEAWKVRTG